MRFCASQTCGVVLQSGNALLLINYLALAAFTAIRVYGVWGRDWRPLVVVLPLALARPAYTIVRPHVSCRTSCTN